MSVTKSGTLVSLTHKQMDRVIETIQSDGEMAGIIAVWTEVLGKSPSEMTEEWAAWDYGIPKVQWKQLCQVIFDSGHSGMNWMNSSPSGIEEGNPNYVEIEEPAHAERL